ncbi:MAG: DUF378 domain-containing protein [bacterium]|nr:DUF378 domain-containing protein [bacterium]
MKVLHMVAFGLLAIGGLNWLLVGAGGWDVVALIFGAGTMLSRAVYVLVGLSAIWEVATHAKTCKMCGKEGMA